MTDSALYTLSPRFQLALSQHLCRRLGVEPGMRVIELVVGDHLELHFRPRRAGEPLGRPPRLRVPRPPKAELARLYVTECRSLEQVGRSYGVHRTTVRRWLAHYGIPRRSLAEERRQWWRQEKRRRKELSEARASEPEGGV